MRRARPHHASYAQLAPGTACTSNTTARLRKAAGPS